MRFYVYTVLAALALLPFSLSASEWVSSNTNWNDSSNWNPPTFPNGPGSSAEFNGGGTATVNITADVSVDSVSFTAGSYTVNSSPGTLTMGNQNVSHMTISAGSHTMAANIDVSNSLMINNNSASPFIIQGQVNNNTTTFGGSGGFHLNASNNTHMRINSGTLVEVNHVSGIQYHPIVSGTLQFNPGLGNINLVGISATGTIDLTNNTLFLHDGNVQGPIIGTGNIVKHVLHALILGGTNTYSGNTTVEEGTLSVTGSVLNSPIQIDAGAYLTGTGSVNTVQNFGTVSPGDNIGDTPETSIGTLTVTGIYQQHSGGDLLIQISDDGSTDVLNATSNVMLDGTLTLDPEPGIYPAGSSFTFMNYLSRAGTLTLLDNSNLDFNIFYLGSSALLINNIQGAILPVPKRLLSGNAREVADYLFCRGFLPSNPDLLHVMAALVRVPADQFADDLVKLSPAQFGALPLVNLHSNRIIADMIVENTEKFYWCDPCDSEKECTVNKTSVWVAPVGYYYDQDGIQGQVGFDSYAVGVGLGASHLFFNSFHVGGGAGYTYSKIDWDEGRGDGHINSVYIGPSLGWSPRNGFLNLLVLGSYNYYDIDRNIKFPRINRTATNKHHSYDVLARLDGGYKFRVNIKGNIDHIYIAPEARLSYLNIFEERYTESGADSINLTVDSKYSALLQPNLLVKFLRDFHTDSWCIMPAFHVGWISNIWLSSGNYKSRFYKQELCQPHFVVKSFTRNTNQLSLGLDMNFRHNNDWIIDVGGRVDFLDDNYIVDGKIKIEKRF